MSAAAPEAFELISRGIVPYGEAWELQQSTHRRVLEGECGAALILLEHSPVITLGKHADRAFVLKGQGELEAMGVELIQSDRGGEATLHMPGQLVIYPILPLSKMRLAPKSYVEKLQTAVIATLEDFGIEASSDKLHPGIWVGQDKICAVGVRISERVSMHGLALNVSNPLTLFQTIVPCGIHDRGVCSMQTILGKAPQRSLVEKSFLKHFHNIFELDLERAASVQSR